jgi:hypothetical protein
MAEHFEPIEKELLYGYNQSKQLVDTQKIKSHATPLQQV